METRRLGNATHGEIVVSYTFENDAFIEDMSILAMDDELEACRLVQEVDSEGAWEGRMFEAFLRQYSARRLSQTAALINQLDKDIPYMSIPLEVGNIVIRPAHQPEGSWQIEAIDSADAEPRMAECSSTEFPASKARFAVSELRLAPSGPNGWMK